MTTVARYEPETIDKALLALAACDGSPVDAKKMLLEEHELDIPAQTLSSWKNRDHPERYKQLAERYWKELEEEIVHLAQRNAKRASEIEAILLEDMLTMDKKEKPQALRAVADVKAKSIDKALALTGRPTDGKSANTDMGSLLKVLVDRGVFSVQEPVEAEVVEES